ncbi:MAG TPA: tRNA pseudouridine(55) synthase TruB [Patescibacteria group bacterium]|jgi:tRNA pseudouridine55 synthase|nr:tRNA pseudouridine(55) synthase TruB [Patescibacteria group bacterium]
MEGVLLINKPLGWTSFDVVKNIRRIIENELKTAKRFPVGHAGTLDPLATGLLIILVGSYTKKASELLKLDKEYIFTMKLGFTSTTDDEEGEKTAISKLIPPRADIDEVVQNFEKTYQQTPPIFSAIKIKGQKSYQLARQGRSVVLEPRTVTVKRLEILGYSYPLIELRAAVSSGTYIRSLARDIGDVLATGGYVTSLRRTKVGQYDLNDAQDMEKISAQSISANLLTK